MNSVSKLWSVIFLAMTVSNMASAKAIDSDAQARKVKDKIESSLFEIDGINGVGITGCNPRTGAFDINHPFVNCIVINTETHDAYHRLVHQFPRGTKIDGVFITIQYVGPIKAL